MAVTNWYVDPDAGDDGTGDGTSEGSAWATLKHATENYTQTANNGDIINIKNSATMTMTAAVYGFSHSGPTPSMTAPLLVRGYSSTIGDGGRAEIGGNYNINDTTQSNLHFQDIYFNGVDRIRTGMYGTLTGCKFASMNDAVQTTNQAKIINCEFVGSAISSMISGSGSYHVFGCHFHTLGGSNPTRFIFCGGQGCIIANNIFNANGVTGAIASSSTTGYSRLIINNTFYAQSSGTYAFDHGIALKIDSNNLAMVVLNNIFEGWLGAIQTSNTQNRPGILINNNHFYDNDNDIDSKNATGISAVSELDNTLSAGSSVLSKSGSNTHANRHTYFAPTGDATSGGDADGSLVHMGAVSPASSGGGGGIMRNPGMTGGFAA